MSDGIKIPMPEIQRSVERIPSPELPKEGAVEGRFEKKAPRQTEKVQEEQAPPAIPVPAVPGAPAVMQKSQLQQDIENILAEDMKELYLSLSPQQKMRFKQEGEKTAAKIEILLKSVRVKISEIIKLIRAWLMILTGMNKFYLEKEVKIKTEQILELNEKE